MQCVTTNELTSSDLVLTHLSLLMFGKQCKMFNFKQISFSLKEANKENFVLHTFAGAGAGALTPLTAAAPRPAAAPPRAPARRLAIINK